MNMLEKTDPAKFDEVMTALEKDMEERAKEQGIDLDAAKAKVDKMMEEEKMKEAEDSKVFTMPDGSRLDKGTGKEARPNAFDPSQGTEIQPTPSFVFKTKELQEEGSKVGLAAGWFGLVCGCAVCRVV